jgi:hypothetical protein
MEEQPEEVEVYVIEEKYNLETSAKDVDTNGDPYDILLQIDDHGTVSNWAVAYAMAPYSEGESVPCMEFDERLQVAVLQQYMDRMVELGYMEAVLQEDGEDVGYRMTPKGELYAISRQQEDS